MGTHTDITASHLQRRSCAYIRQSSEEQLRRCKGSTALQRDLPTLLEAHGWTLSQIDVLDEDLGVTASIPGFRQGFAGLLEAIRANIYGAVAVIDDSRPFRNLLGFAEFAHLAQAHDVLLIQPGRVTNFRDPDAAFIETILGANAARENRKRAILMTLARKKKAEAGIATTRPPIGYIALSGGLWDKDPDPRVREVLGLIFAKFLELRRTGRLWRYMLAHDLQLPYRCRGGALRWGPPKKPKLRFILKNESYTGTYLYAKTHIAPNPAPGSRPFRQVPRPSVQWIRKPNHHPAYVTPEEFSDIQDCLQKNRASNSPAAGRGEALFQGMLRCTIHNIRLHTCYPYRHRKSRSGKYFCDPRAQTAIDESCASIASRVLDPFLEAELLGTLSPPSVDILTAAAREALREHGALQRARDQELRLAEIRVAEAEREYDHTNAARHRLVKNRLREKYEQALQELERVQHSHRLHPLIPPLTLDAPDIDKLRLLLDDLPRLWRHPYVSAEQRKMIVRTVMKHVLVTPERDAWTLEIHWVGGATTPMKLLKRHEAERQAVLAYRTGGSVPAIVADFAQRGIVRRSGNRAGEPYDAASINALIRNRRLREEFDLQALLHIRRRALEYTPSRQIADELNSSGIRHRCGHWTVDRVQGAVCRLRHRPIPGVDPLPPVASLRERVVSFNNQGHLPRKIANVLCEEGCRTQRGSKLTADTVRKILSSAKVPPASITLDQQLEAFLRAHAPTTSVRLMVQRLDELAFRTRRGYRWTEVHLNRKLARLGLRIPKKRRPRTPRVSP